VMAAVQAVRPRGLRTSAGWVPCPATLPSPAEFACDYGQGDGHHRRTPARSVWFGRAERFERRCYPLPRSLVAAPERHNWVTGIAFSDG